MVVDGEEHADRRPAARARLDPEALGELGHQWQADAEARAVVARLHPTAVVAHVDLDPVVGMAPGEDLDVARLWRLDVGMDHDVGDRLGHGERDRVGVEGPVLARVRLDLAASEPYLVGARGEATGEHGRVHAQAVPRWRSRKQPLGRASDQRTRSCASEGAHARGLADACVGAALMQGRRATVASWLLAVLATLSLAAGGLLLYAEHALFDSDEFADRTAATLQDGAVRDAAARRLAGVVTGVKPDLVALGRSSSSARAAWWARRPFARWCAAPRYEAHRSAFAATTPG